MLMSLWYRQLDRVLVAAATRISPVTFYFSSNVESNDKRLLWLPRKPDCRQFLQFLWHCRWDCFPWLKSPWPNPVLAHTVSVNCEFCSEMTSSFKCACSDAQLYRAGWDRLLESARRPARVDGETHPSCLRCTLVFPTVSRCVLHFLWQGFLYSCLRPSVVLSPYLQLSVTGFLLLACFCIFL